MENFVAENSVFFMEKMSHALSEGGVAGVEEGDRP